MVLARVSVSLLMLEHVVVFDEKNTTQTMRVKIRYVLSRLVIYA
jgi:hypothetical protein